MAGHMQGFERVIHSVHGVRHAVEKNAPGQSSPWKASKAESTERKSAEQFAKMIDSKSFVPEAFAFFFNSETTTAQHTMFEIMVHLMTIWGDYYKNGTVKPEAGKSYQICKWAYEVSTMKHPQPPK